ncbi:2OG-Fe(II) oxygenase family protein [Candidatus Viadribacter manganicus]|uniref:Fe2OG dioxygenase domain-containing protein n=1 Tax=Candidatus Viadribacter manganicus TaxID=1759059 RepID=A0A1B1ADH0_9PROT|nr:2OG-Fe(II) oxygenase [Candidatus Viadribacter manganicus]ANP44602.1 hypothetical protein ATE48_01025 [Candidatus Viadribacter manganicus]
MTAKTPPAVRPLGFGEPLPLLHARSNRNERFALGSMAGRFVLICAIKEPGAKEAQTALAAISHEPSDESTHLCAIFTDGQTSDALQRLTNARLVFNDAKIAETTGLFDKIAPAGRWLLFDPALRVIGMWRLDDAKSALRAFNNCPAPERYYAHSNAPVLVAPNVFEPDFCKRLIQYYRTQGGAASGVTKQDATGRTFVSLDDAFKRRSDCLIDDAALRESAMQRVYWRLAPMIERAFMWRPTRMERYLVARYDAENGGFFRPHRDNTTNGTAHRRFAVTINLNAADYEGGDLRFPEFGPRIYRAPTGGAVVFSCALLHEATPVTRGERFAFLPFLYDDASAKVREANNRYLDDTLMQYRDA